MSDKEEESFTLGQQNIRDTNTERINRMEETLSNQENAIMGLTDKIDTLLQTLLQGRNNKDSDMDSGGDNDEYGHLPKTPLDTKTRRSSLLRNKQDTTPGKMITMVAAPTTFKPSKITKTEYS